MLSGQWRSGASRNANFLFPRSSSSPVLTTLKLAFSSE